MVFEGSTPIVYGQDESRTAGGLSSPLVMGRLPVGTYVMRADYSGGQQVHHHGHGTSPPHGVLIDLPPTTITSKFVVADCSSTPKVAKVSRSMPSLALSAPSCTPGVMYRWTAYAGPRDGNRELTSTDGCTATIFSRIGDVRVGKIALTRSTFPNTRWIVSKGVSADRIEYGDLPKVAARRIGDTAVWIREWSPRTRSMLNLDSLKRSTPYIAPDEDLDLLLGWLNWFGCDDGSRGYGGAGRVPNFAAWCRSYSYSSADAIVGEYAPAYSAKPSGALTELQVDRSSPGACFTAFGEWQRLHRDVQKLVDIRRDVWAAARNISLNEWRRIGEVGTIYLTTVGTALALYASVQVIASAFAAGEAAAFIAGLLARIGIQVPLSLLTPAFIADAIAFLTSITQVVINLGTGQYSESSDPYRFQLTSDVLSLFGGFKLVRAIGSRGSNLVTWVERGTTLANYVNNVSQLADASAYWSNRSAFLESFTLSSALYQNQLGRSYVQAAVLRRSIDACNQAIG